MLVFTYFGGEERLVVELVLRPRHEVVNVLGRRALDGLLDGVSVGPVVLILGPRRHHRARLLSAELRDGAVQHVDLVEKVHRCRHKRGLHTKSRHLNHK